MTRNWGKAMIDRKNNLKPTIIPLLFAISAVIVAYFHDTFEEWDGVMQLFAGREIFQGMGYQGWTSHFWPPLYSSLVGLLDLFIDGFWAAKIVSIVPGSVLLYVVYKFAVFLTSNSKVGILSQAFLALNPLYFLSTIQAENHMLDSLFFVTGLFLLLRAVENRSTKSFIIVGIIFALACLIRYTSYVLLPLALIIVFLSFNLKNAIKMSLAFLLPFLVVSLPWYYVNMVNNGSPLFTWQYMNIGSAFVDSNHVRWWWLTQANYNGIQDIIVSHPIPYLKNFLMNCIRSGVIILTSAIVLAPAVFPALFDGFINMKSKLFFPLIGGLFLFVVLVSQAFVFDQVFLSWLVVITILSVHFLLGYLKRCKEKYNVLKRLKFTVLVWSFVLIGGLFITAYCVGGYVLGDDYDSGQLADVKIIANTLQRYDVNIQDKYIMAINPSNAYYIGGKFLMAPLYYEGDIEGLCTYKGISDHIQEYAPKYPTTTPLSNLRADYLIYNKGLAKYLPQYSFLFDPTSESIPDNFRLIYQSETVVVYEILHDVSLGD